MSEARTVSDLSPYGPDRYAPHAPGSVGRRRLVLILAWRADLLWRRSHARSMELWALYHKDSWWDEVEPKGRHK